MFKKRSHRCWLGVIVLSLSLLTACQPADNETPTTVPTVVAQASATARPTETATVTATENPLPVVIPSEVAPEGMALVTPTWTPTPTYTPSPTPLPPPTPTPSPPPPIQPGSPPAELVQALAVLTVAGVEGYPLYRITGWEKGMRQPLPYCDARPYRWLDNSHLLLYASLERIESEMSTLESAWPSVVDLADGQIWFPPVVERLVWCSRLEWSTAFQTLVVPQGQFTYLVNLEGEVIDTYPGVPRALSPSGRYLLTLSSGMYWYDLQSGESFSWGNYSGIAGPITWSGDERRLFACCYFYLDVNSRESISFDINLQPGGSGVRPGFDGYHSRWLLNERYTMVDWALDNNSGAEYHPFPFIDPTTQTYRDATSLTGQAVYECNLPIPAPDQHHLFFPSCDGQLALFRYEATTEMLQLLQVLGNVQLRSWSPDNRFALLEWNVAGAFESSQDYRLLRLEDGTIFPVGERVEKTVWSGEHLIILQDGVLHVLDTGNWTVIQRTLPQDIQAMFAPPGSEGLLVQAADGSWWWTADPATLPSLEAVTPPLPAGHQLQWSPDRSKVAFVSGTDLYVITLTKTE